MEGIVVAAIASLVLLLLSFFLSRTGQTIKRGSDLLNTQVVLEEIVDALDADIRELTAVDWADCGDTRFSFRAIGSKSGGGGPGTGGRITYAFQKPAGGHGAGSLTRIEAGRPGEPSVLGTRQVGDLLFFPVKRVDGQLDHLILFVRLVSDEKGSGPASRLTFVEFFHPRYRSFVLPGLPGHRP